MKNDARPNSSRRMQLKSDGEWDQGRCTDREAQKALLMLMSGSCSNPLVSTTSQLENLRLLRQELEISCGLWSPDNIQEVTRKSRFGRGCAKSLELNKERVLEIRESKAQGQGIAAVQSGPGQAQSTYSLTSSLVHEISREGVIECSSAEGGHLRPQVDIQQLANRTPFPVSSVEFQSTATDPLVCQSKTSFMKPDLEADVYEAVDFLSQQAQENNLEAVLKEVTLNLTLPLGAAPAITDQAPLDGVTLDLTIATAGRNDLVLLEPILDSI